MVQPFVTQLGFGGVLGFTAGYAFKKAAKVAAIGVGVVFAGLQVLSYNEVISLNWAKIESVSHEKLDQVKKKYSKDGVLFFFFSHTTRPAMANLTNKTFRPLSRALSKC